MISFGSLLVVVYNSVSWIGLLRSLTTVSKFDSFGREDAIPISTSGKKKQKNETLLPNYELYFVFLESNNFMNIKVSFHKVSFLLHVAEKKILFMIVLPIFGKKQGWNHQKCTLQQTKIRG